MRHTSFMALCAIALAFFAMVVFTTAPAEGAGFNTVAVAGNGFSANVNGFGRVQVRGPLGFPRPLASIRANRGFPVARLGGLRFNNNFARVNVAVNPFGFNRFRGANVVVNPFGFNRFRGVNVAVNPFAFNRFNNVARFNATRFNTFGTRRVVDGFGNVFEVDVFGNAVARGNAFRGFNVVNTVSPFGFASFNRGVAVQASPFAFNTGFGGFHSGFSNVGFSNVGFGGCGH